MILYRSARFQVTSLVMSQMNVNPLPALAAKPNGNDNWLIYMQQYMTTLLGRDTTGFAKATYEDHHIWLSHKKRKKLISAANI